MYSQLMRLESMRSVAAGVRGLFVLALIACGSTTGSGASNLDSAEPPTRRPWDNQAEANFSQLVIGLVLNQESPEEVRLVAVTHDRTGEQSEVDLGVFPEFAAEPEPIGNELIHLIFKNDKETHELRILSNEKGLEIRRFPHGSPAQSPGVLLHEIRVPKGTEIKLQQPAVVYPPKSKSKLR